MLKVRNFIANQSGATAVEYGLIIALIGAIAMGAYRTMGQRIGQKTNETSAVIQLDPADRPSQPTIVVPTDRAASGGAATP